MWTTAQNVRDVLGLDIDTADDEILEEFIQDAQEQLKKYIQLDVLDEEASGNINGTNATFSLEHAFIADTDFDGRISVSDFQVYGWPDRDNPFTKVQLTVSTFDPLRGIFVLGSAPEAGVYEIITCDYSYYTKRIDWDILAQATQWKAAEIWVKREEFLVPDRVFIGTTRVYQSQPWKHFEREVRRLIDKLVALPMDKIAYAKLVFGPRSELPEVDTASAREMRTIPSEPAGDPRTGKPDLT